jgi:hypothetical protein
VRGMETYFLSDFTFTSRYLHEPYMEIHKNMHLLYKIISIVEEKEEWMST